MEQCEPTCDSTHHNTREGVYLVSSKCGTTLHLTRACLRPCHMYRFRRLHTHSHSPGPPVPSGYLSFLKYASVVHASLSQTTQICSICLFYTRFLPTLVLYLHAFGHTQTEELWGQQSRIPLSLPLPPTTSSCGGRKGELGEGEAEGPAKTGDRRPRVLRAWERRPRRRWTFSRVRVRWRKAAGEV